MLNGQDNNKSGRRQQGEERPAGGAPPVPIQPPPPASVPANPPAAAIIEGVPQIPQPQGEQQAGEGANPIFQQNNAGERGEDEGEEQMPVLELEEPMGARAEAQRISTWNPAYITLHYVLLLIFGEHGYHRGIPVRNAPWVPGFAQQGAGGNNSDNGSNGHADNDPPIQGGRRATVTELEYYAYMLFPREFFTSEDAMPGPDVHFGTIFRACRLFQQFLVDIWAIIDQARLIWMRMNQATIRRDLYLGLVDALHTDNFAAGANQGTILASSYYGGARQMAESYQDAMAIARYLGPPQFFVTMTANPNWPELKNALLPGQVPADRPDLAVRVFELKRRALLHDIAKKHILGRCIAHVHTIEFQKMSGPCRLSFVVLK
ncbi:Helitron helicase-like domain at N-terminus [Ceratobasidium sp. AG-Ba]|nr:Helitron helicase-like domain at N-terminus [Ceratobasidium sp. AG-Ba]